MNLYSTINSFFIVGTLEAANYYLCILQQNIPTINDNQQRTQQLFIIYHEIINSVNTKS